MAAEIIDKNQIMRSVGQEIIDVPYPMFYFYE